MGFLIRNFAFNMNIVIIPKKVLILLSFIVLVIILRLKTLRDSLYQGGGIAGIGIESPKTSILVEVCQIKWKLG